MFGVCHKKNTITPEAKNAIPWYRARWRLSERCCDAHAIALGEGAKVKWRSAQVDGLARAHVKSRHAGQIIVSIVE